MFLLQHFEIHLFAHIFSSFSDTVYTMLKLEQELVQNSESDSYDEHLMEEAGGCTASDDTFPVAP